MVEDHKVDIIKSKPVKGCINCRCPVIVIICPHLGRHKDFFPGYKALINRLLYPTPNTGFIPIDPSRVDQAVSVTERPIDRVFRFFL